MIDHKTLAELEECAQRAADYSGAFRDAVRMQAVVHQLDPQALGRYVKARLADKLAKLNAERETMERLQEAFDFGGADEC